jgi:peptide deformylase
MIRNIELYPSNILLEACEFVHPYDITDKTYSSVIIDLKETLISHDSAVGLAANQIAESISIAIIKLLENNEYMTLINPKIINASKTYSVGNEGCLSFYNMTSEVYRHDWINIEYRDESFKKQYIKLHDFSARVVQHEIDHLNGITIADRGKLIEL